VKFVTLPLDGAPRRSAAGLAGLAVTFPWPFLSPDIASRHLLLWECVKDAVYATKVTGVDDLKARIGDVITTAGRGALVARGDNRDSDWTFPFDTQNCAECMKNLCMRPSNKISFTFCWQFVILNLILKLVRDFWFTPNFHKSIVIRK
jgi:hypothetical protein